MTILFLTRRFYPDVGGVEKHVWEIGKRLVSEGHLVTVITESNGSQKEIDGIKIKRIKTPNSWFKKFYIWKWLVLNISLINNSNIVHAHDVYYWYFPFRFLFPLKKSFVTFHGYESYPIRKRAIFVRKISEKLSSGNIIVGDFIKKWYKTKPSFIIYGGVEVPSVQIEPKKRESAIFIGRLDYHTGILEYAKAVEIIKKKYPNFEFSIVGDGEYRNKLKKFKLLGFKKDVDKYFKEHNFAFVSRYLSILEALASRRLIFALYDNSIKEDYLKMSPFAKFVIITNSYEEIADKVDYFLGNPKKAEEIVEEGFRWVSGQTWEKVTNTYLKLWKLS